MKKLLVEIKLLPASYDNNGCIYCKDDNIIHSTSKPNYGYLPYKMSFCVNNKVIASSDGMINGNNIPLIPQSFISKFCRTNASIKEVLINWNEETNEPIVRRIDNTVIVSKMKDTFTRDDVDKILSEFVEDYDSTMLTEYLIEKENIITS